MHTLIMGQTETGKTTLAKILAIQCLNQGRKVAVLDPISTNWGDEIEHFSSVDELMEFAKKPEVKNYLLIIDEAAITMDRYDRDQLWLGKTSRHGGHATVYIGQDWTDVPKGIRTQCTQFFIFSCMRNECEELRNRFNMEKIMEACDLKTFEFFRILSKQKTIQRGRVNRGKMEIILEKSVDSARQ